MTGRYDGDDPLRRAGAEHRHDGADIGKIGTDSLFAGVAGVCRTAVRLTDVDGAAVAVLTASSSRELVYATDATAQQIDELQFVLGEGPCLDAYVHNRPQLCNQLSTVADQWPAFVAEVMNLGVAAVFAFPVPGPQHPLGVLELYRRTAGGLDDDKQESARLCAATVGQTMLSNWALEAVRTGGAERAIDAVALAGAERAEPTDEFTRSQVYVAAGMVAVQLAIPVDLALDRLRAYSYANRRSVLAVAADIVARRLSMHDDSDDGKE